MNDDLTSKAPIQDATSADQDSEEPKNSTQIFDITPDLDISLATDDLEKPKPYSGVSDIPKPPTTNPIKMAEKNIVAEDATDAQFSDPISAMPSDSTPRTTFIPIQIPDSFKRKQDQTASSGQTEQMIPVTTNVPPVRPSTEITAKQNPTASDRVFEQTTAPISIQPTKQQPPIASQKIDSQTDSNHPQAPSTGAYNDKFIKTYEQDFANAVAHKHLTTTSAIIAEKERAEKSREKSDSEILQDAQNQEIKQEKHTLRNVLLSIISLALIGGGAFSAYYLYSKSPLAPSTPVQTPVAQVAQSIISSDSRAIVNISNLSVNSALSLIRSEIGKPQDSGTVKEIVIAQAGSSTEKLVRLTAPQIIDQADITVPDMFRRSLGTNWMLGTYVDDSGQKSTFILTTNSFFQNTFAGMIQWESTIIDDLKQYLLSPSIVTTGTTTGTSTSSTTQEISLRGKFTDRIVKNKDVREFIDTNGNIVFLYSFISNDKLVFTNSESALEEVISRLEKNAYVR